MPRLPLGRPKLDRVTWTSLIEDYVHKHGGPVDYPELKRAVAESPLKENFEKNDKSFYGAITKLLDAKKIVRHRGRLFSPEGLEKYSLDVMSGLVEELPDASKGRPSPAAMEVLKLLKGTPEGLRSGDIVAHLRAMPEYKRQIDRNATYAYNVFSRLVRRGNVRKEDGLYKFVSEENEAPSGDTDEASETGE
ncbi:MAG: hypothetical protein JWO28_1542 [Hyphomicrobiales bacterium]|nr:hypothetical protein [Hyphomicrobiales bacterium]